MKLYYGKYKIAPIFFTLFCTQIFMHYPRKLTVNPRNVFEIESLKTSTNPASIIILHVIMISTACLNLYSPPSPPPDTGLQWSPSTKKTPSYLPRLQWSPAQEEATERRTEAPGSDPDPLTPRPRPLTSICLCELLIRCVSLHFFRLPRFWNRAL